MNNRFLVVGDIHGCPRQLEEILALAETYPDHRWVFLGDYIDRGPDSESVIQILSRFEGIFLLGNHEDMLLDRCQQPTHPGTFLHRDDRSGLSDASIEWIRTVPVDHWETDDYFFVHGGLDPFRALNRQTREIYLWSRYAGDYHMLTPKLVIHGHTLVDEPEVVGNRININTGCGCGGVLTALVLPEFRFVFSSPSPQFVSKREDARPASPFDENLEEL